MTIWQKLREVALQNGDDKIYCLPSEYDEARRIEFGENSDGAQWESVVYGDRCIYIIGDYDGTNYIEVVPRKIPKDHEVFSL